MDDKIETNQITKNKINKIKLLDFNHSVNNSEFPLKEFNSQSLIKKSNLKNNQANSNNILKNNFMKKQQQSQNSSNISNLKAYASRERYASLSNANASYKSYFYYDETIFNKKIKFINKILTYILISLAVSNITIVTLLYVDNFSIMQDDESKDEILKTISICLSTLNIIILIIHYTMCLRFNNFQYILLYKNEKATINYFLLSIEIFIHLLLPIPYINSKINKWLFTLSILRLYSIVKIVFNYFLYEKSIGFLILYKIKNINLYLFKIVIQENSLISLSILLISS